MKFEVWNIDITQDFLQSSADISSKVYPDLPKEFNVLHYQNFQLIEPLHGLEDSGKHCHETFKDHFC